MPESNPSPDTSLRLRRTFAAPRERVFRAWTEPAALKRWFRAADGHTTPVAEVDLRVGGRYRLGMQPPDSDTVLVVGGIYQEVLPPARLVFTWRWEGADAGEPETLVTVEFHERGAMTDVELIHEQFAGVAQRDQHAQGWQGCLDGLARTLAEKEV